MRSYRWMFGYDTITGESLVKTTVVEKSTEESVKEGEDVNADVEQVKAATETPTEESK